MTRGIDHLVVGIRDLDAGARLYEAMGFQVGARNRHPWGTENRLVQFDGSFIELITKGSEGEPPGHEPRRFSFGAFVCDALARREGFSMLVLDSADGQADAGVFKAAGIGDFEPFSFERRGRRPDGTEVEVAFTLAFARDEAAPHAGFFVCQQHHPENFWNPAFQTHRNGALGISAVVLAAGDPARHEDFLRAFTGAEATGTGRDLSFPLSRGRLDVLTPDDAAELYGSVETADAPALCAYTVTVGDIDRVARHLSGGVPHQRIGSRIVVPASAAHGVAIAFEQSLSDLDPERAAS
ncbi:VOC family protein [Salinarimonas soli]|uniref:VOC family protein n=1 Tax=Salinarimonas soli TaxID=1638099 RepID=A0A5B2W100_9HYPH|nr:VOC family protein [Salinarimonas soli]KAA2243939.1 VOC family protein [Salinarimonas soli]